jgi:hypothetical protein
MTKYADTPIQIDFMVPGFSKCGTTTLSAMLARHPRLVLPSEKEPSLFVDDEYEAHWPNYLALYPKERDGRLFGDDSTRYASVFEEVAARSRIAKLYPNCKLIFIARDPLKRIESSFREFHHSGMFWGIDADFDPNTAVKQLPAMVEDSLYGARLDNYLRHWPRERVLIVLLEEFAAHPERELRRCFEFLGVDAEPAAHIALERLNAQELKLRDTRLLRYLRKRRFWNTRLAKLSLPQQDRLLRPLGLRRPFTEPLAWRPETLAWLADRLQDDITQFLALQDKTLDVWPAFARLCRTYGRPVDAPQIDDRADALADDRVA